MEQLASNEQQCLNCQQPLQGEYCHHCGQHHRVYVRSIFAVLGDLMGELGHWDSRFYRTLRGLILRPGFLSREFMAGKHVAYVPPLRLYFFISLIAFVIFSAAIDIEVVSNNSDPISVEEPSGAVEVMTPEDMRMDLPFLPEAEQTRINERLRYLTKNPDLFVKRLASHYL
ncbi:MAG: DUF3667 domain-containing protein [Gammaproteobacteria bacterium]|nr:DUF3667 domain-containing protein [Gammaproteobacteria bacterium]